MKERVLVKYHYQNDPHDKTPNCFFISKDSDRPLLILDLLADFPGIRVREYGDSGYHFRFLDRLGKSACWVDIKNLNAAVPVSKGVVEMKVLVTSRQSDSLIFGSLEVDLDRRETRSTQAEKSQGQGQGQGRKSGGTGQGTSTATPAPTGDRQGDRQGGVEAPRPKTQAATSTPTAQTQPQTPTPTQTRATGGDFARVDDFDLGFGASPTGTASKPPAQTKASEFDILAEGHATPTGGEESKGGGVTDEQRMYDMFGDDFNPQARNRGLEAAKIKAEQAGKAALRIQGIDDDHLKMLKMQDAKINAGQILEPKIKQWSTASNGQRNNIRILLTTLQHIMWEGSTLEPISLSDLVNDSHVKRQYMKAITKVHPDHNSEVTDPNVLYLMDRVFNILNDSYNEFQKIQKK